jgi:hypothetical protein
MFSKFNVNDVWTLVREKYPDARFSFFFSNGELIFYPSGDAEHEFSATIKNGRLEITEDF